MDDVTTGILIALIALLCVTQIILGLSVWSLGYYALKYELEREDLIRFITKLPLFPGVFFDDHGYSAFLCAGLRGYVGELLSTEKRQVVLARNAYALVILAILALFTYAGIVTETHSYRVGAIITLLVVAVFLWFAWNFGKKSKDVLT